MVNKAKKHSLYDKDHKLERRTKKGDQEAINELFEYAETIATTDQFEEAIAVYREVAYIFRRTASWNQLLLDEAKQLNKWHERVREIYQAWIEQNPQGFRKLPYIAEGFSEESIRSVLLNEMQNEEFYLGIFHFIANTLTSQGVVFSSPGGSPQRHIWILVSKAFGFFPPSHDVRLNNLDIRIGVDLLADEVVKRCQGGFR